MLFENRGRTVKKERLIEEVDETEEIHISLSFPSWHEPLVRRRRDPGRRRRQLLVRLKDRAGLTFREISEFDLFASLQFASLQQFYENARKVMHGK
jgi:hypothetical protein